MQDINIPKVSVCMVTYNQEKYIRQCLQSIVDQETNFNFEVLVSDDCSTDATRSIVREFASQYPEIVKPMFRDSNVGAFKNFVLIHNAATGEYVSHCDGDDLFLPNKLQKQFDCLQENPGCMVSWHRVNYFDDEGWSFDGKDYDYSMFSGGVVTLEKSLRLGAVATHSSMMYRRSARKTFHPTFDVVDGFYFWEYLSSGWGVILDDVLGEYRVDASNAITASSGFTIKLMYAHHAMYFFRAHPEHRRAVFIFALTNFLLDLKNRRKSAINFFILTLRTFSLVSPFEFIAHLREVKKLITPKPSSAQNM